jgi:hypothetical protein
MRDATWGDVRSLGSSGCTLLYRSGVSRVALFIIVGSSCAVLLSSSSSSSSSFSDSLDDSLDDGGMYPARGALMTATDSLCCCCGGGGAGGSGITVLAIHIKMLMVGWRRAWVVDLRYRLRVFTAECLASMILSPAMMVLLYDTARKTMKSWNAVSLTMSRTSECWNVLSRSLNKIPCDGMSLMLDMIQHGANEHNRRLWGQS